ncbi:MAG: 4Fe-4S dicluster domain-containing protein [Ruminococcus sp.]|nr:4Fe-4S dicluster domain-containing protein [Ruminococcus sp.]
MSIAIDKEKCVGCGKCHDVCPGTLIKIDTDKKAYIKYPKDCWGCTSCIKECPVYAISFFLGADIGGMGSRVHTEKKDGMLRWIIEHPDSKITEIEINPKESNKY